MLSKFVFASLIPPSYCVLLFIFYEKQLGHIIFTGNYSNTVVPISFKSYKAQRLAMSGDLIAFCDMFDITIANGQEVERVLSRRVSIQLLTDRKSLFDVLSEGSKTSDKGMILDIAAVREGFRDKII